MVADFESDFPTLDPGIRDAVRILREAGVETFESCEGGVGHAYAEPTVRFHGIRAAGWRALCIAQEYGLPVAALRRTWPILDGEPVGPYWEIVFREKCVRLPASPAERFAPHSRLSMLRLDPPAVGTVVVVVVHVAMLGWIF